MTDIKEKISYKLNTIIAILVGIVVLCSSTIAVNNYVAKATDIKQLKDIDNSLLKRLEIGILEDQIFQLEMCIQKTIFYRSFELRTEMKPLTPIEEQSLNDMRTKLVRLKLHRDRIINN